MSTYVKGALVEYGLSIPPLAIVFEFNPQTISRTRTINIKTGSAPGTKGGYDFLLPTETPRASQGVSMEPEKFSVDILLDSQDRPSDDAIAAEFGIQPQLDTLRSMVEPKMQGPGGVQLLSDLGLGSARAFEHQLSASVLLFIWGGRILPVFLSSVKIDEQAHLPNLFPYQARVSLTMQVIEGNNPFYAVETLRQVVSTALNTVQLSSDVLGAIFG